MRPSGICASLAVWTILAVLLSAQVFAGERDGLMFGQSRLEKLLAPIALCPDDLLVKILTAATYPLEITQAARLAQAKGNRSGPGLASLLDEQAWDGSVKSLVNFPSILGMMNQRIDWTQELGDAFLIQKADVMAVVQELRQRAQSRPRPYGATGLSQPTYEATNRGNLTSSYVVQGSPVPGGFIQSSHVLQVSGNRPLRRRAGGFGLFAGPRGRPVFRALTFRRMLRRRR